MTDLSAFPITAPLAGRASRPAPALFAEHAQRREGLDHARGDRPALRAAHGRHRQERELDARNILSLNPNGKIPAIIDPDGPGGKPLGAVRIGRDPALPRRQDRAADPADPARRWETIQWVFFQMAAIGPMFGQVGYFNRFAGKAIEDKRPLQRYVDESKRLLGVLEGRLEGRELDHGRVQRRRHRDCWAGCATSSPSTRRASWSSSTGCATSRLARAGPGAAGGAARAGDSEAG